MYIRARAFWLPKAGNAPEEYEDAFWPQRPVDQQEERFRFAVADGATETSFAGIWARMLVRAWCRGQLGRRRMQRSLPALQRAWLAKAQSRPLPWYAEEKLRSGAFSSLLGLALSQDERREGLGWVALAVGDSCLVQVRDGRVLAAFPLTESDAFDNRPALLSSNPCSNGGVGQHVRCTSGAWLPGDSFYLMTDALACWFLRSLERGEDPCDAIGYLMAEAEDGRFQRWMAELRESGAIRNDDVTLLAAAVE